MKKNKVIKREDCYKNKPKLYWMHPEALDALKSMRDALGYDYPFFWLVNLSVVLLKTLLTPEVIARVENGESLAKIFELKG